MRSRGSWAAGGLIVKQMSDSAARHRLAKEIVTFYQQLGSCEGRLDSMLAEAEQPSPRVPASWIKRFRLVLLRPTSRKLLAILISVAILNTGT